MSKKHHLHRPTSQPLCASADTDPDVPKIRKVLGELQNLVATEEITPELANRVLGNYADDLRNPGQRTRAHQRATIGPLAKLKLRY